MFKLDRKSKVNKALIQRCVEKGLLDDSFLQQSLDLELVNLARRIIEQPESVTSSDNELDEKEPVEEVVVLGFGRNNESQLAPASKGEVIRQPTEITGTEAVKLRRSHC